MDQQLIKPQINSREVCDLTGIFHRDFIHAMERYEEAGVILPVKRTDIARTVGTETVALFVGQAAFMDAARIAQVFTPIGGGRIISEFYHRLARLTEWQESIGQVMGADVTKGGK